MSVIYIAVAGLLLGFILMAVVGRHPVPILREDGGTEGGGLELPPDKAGFRRFTSLEAFAEAMHALVTAQGMEVAALQRSGEDEFEIHARLPGELVSGLVIFHCRMSDEPVTAERVEELKSSVRGERGLKGVFVTTDYFTADVHKIVEGSPIEFVNVERLSALLDEYGIPGG